MKMRTVYEPEFTAYGRVVKGYDTAALTEAMLHTPLPEDVVYVASVPELEALPIAAEFADGIYGQMPIQIGYCNGHNKKLNALEYHRDSEVNLAVTDLVLLIGKQQDITEDYTYDTSLVEAFFVPAGTLIEVGQGKREAHTMSQILEAKDRKKAGFTAPAKGLFLTEVFYS